MKKDPKNPLLQARVSEQEKIGMLCMQHLILFNSCFSPEISSLFERRTEEGYDIKDTTALGCL